MKHPFNLVLGTFPVDHVPCEESPGNLLTHLPEADLHLSHLKQNVDQLLARYKRAGYEAFTRWDLNRSVTK